MLNSAAGELNYLELRGSKCSFSDTILLQTKSAIVKIVFCVVLSTSYTVFLL